MTDSPIDDTAVDNTAIDNTAIDSLIDRWSDDPRLVHVEDLPARPARLAEPANALHPLVEEHLGDRVLWSHQARAVDLLRDRRSVVLATPTSSGKSLCYQIPAIEAALDRHASTLMVFPTKALAQDQLRSLSRWDVPGLVAATYDGDCTAEERTWVRANADVLLTNPEMLHHGILPNHSRWASFLHRLELVVVDELHVLRGIFGSHTAQVLRRLRRLADLYGASPQFVFTSATIGEPARLATELCGLPVTAITADGSPSGHRSIALWNPFAGGDPSATSGGAPRSASLHQESAAVAAELIATGLRTIVFCRSRRSTELIAADIRRRVGGETIRAYRGGYLAGERREIEQELFSGRLHCVVATTALELGVDVEGIDAVVLSGFPGTTASFWQQIGRAGRGRRPSLAVLVADSNQLDQWMIRNPSQLLSAEAETAVINPDNPTVFVPHLACAAQEQALTHDDLELWPEQLDEGVRQLVLGDRLSVRRRRGRRIAAWSGRGIPAATIGLRRSTVGELTVRDRDDRPVATVDAGRAPAIVHPGAVYLHQGRSWRVVDLDLDAAVAVVEPTDDDIYTATRSATSIRILDTSATRTVGTTLCGLGTVEVTTTVLGYRTCRSVDHEVLERTTLELPPTMLITRGLWYRFDDSALRRACVTDTDLPGALHAIEHAAIGILPLFTICDRWDVGGVSTPWLDDASGPTVVLHDAHAGGSGIAELAFEVAEGHLTATLDVISGCECDAGCPGCVQSPSCGSGNEPLAKDAAIRLLHRSLDDAAGHGERTAS